jgi:hypothetical protein
MAWFLCSLVPEANILAHYIILLSWIVAKNTRILGAETMINKRSRFGERRRYSEMLRVPFKDSNGVTITECRRQIPDRRIDNIHAEWINEIVIR